MRKIKLITFADGGYNYVDAGSRLLKQAESIKKINEFKLYNSKNLPNEYWDTFGDLYIKYPLGFGLWSWKPSIVKYELEKMNEGDILIYMDVGCEINRHGIKKFDEYLEFVNDNDSLFFELNHLNKFWTKKNKILTGNINYIDRKQVVATAFIIKKNEKILKLINDWYYLCSHNNCELLKDPKINEEQIDGFKFHRHDQSCLSLAIYNNNIKVIKDETYSDDWKVINKNPILALRNKSGKSKIYKIYSFGFKRLYYKIKN